MKIHFGLVILLVGLLTATATAQSGTKRLAVVNGAAITEAQVTRAAAADLEKLEKRRAQAGAGYAREKLAIMWKALDSIVEDKLLSAEAVREKKTKQELIYAEIESNVEVPSAAEVEAFYQANKASIPLPHDEALPQVKQYMTDQSRKRYRDPLIERLKKQFGVTTYLDPLRADVATAGHPSRGPANAPVTIVEFADFECPYCGGLYPTLKTIEKNYAATVRIVYRQFPLNNVHPRAQKAAEASLCANEQNRFWEFHDSMFGNQQDLTVPALKQRAVDFKLDTAAFNSCLDSGRLAGAVKKDSAEGASAGVTSTPSMFINGRMVSGNRPYADLKEVIDDELRRNKVVVPQSSGTKR